MEKLGRETLLSRIGEIDEKELLLGFHRPPHNSVFHLHLHVVYPKSKMNARQTKRICNGGWTTIKQLRKRSSFFKFSKSGNELKVVRNQDKSSLPLFS